MFKKSYCIQSFRRSNGMLQIFDVTRTIVAGKPTQRQIDVWNLEKKAQDAAFAAIQIGAPCEQVDAAARAVIEKGGFSTNYKLPGQPKDI